MSNSAENTASDDRLIGLQNWTPPWLLQKTMEGNDATDRTVADVLDVVRKAAEQWDLRILAPYPDITHNFVAPVISTQHGPAVLKIALGKYMYRRESRALRSFAGDGAVKVLEWDDSLFAMLLEKADPGKPMMLDWDSQTEAFCGLLKTLWKPVSEELALPSVAVEAEARIYDLSVMEDLLSSDHDRHSTIQTARLVLTDLIGSSDERFLVHGDLHTGNILSSHRLPWLCIDPIGCIGERTFDACTILRDDTEELQKSSDPRALVERRIMDLASECNLDSQRVRAWSFVEAVRIQGWRYKIGRPIEEWSTLIPLLHP